MQELGAQVILVPGGYAGAENAGLTYAQEIGATWVSPYNDNQVIAGQGTISLEILRNHTNLANATWIVPTSGGGLISGIGAFLKHDSPMARLVAVQAAASPFMYALYFGRTQDGVEDQATIADGLSGPVQAGSITIPLVQHYVDDFVLVSEHEIEMAVAYAWWQYGEKLEGSPDGA